MYMGSTKFYRAIGLQIQIDMMDPLIHAENGLQRNQQGRLH